MHFKKILGVYPTRTTTTIASGPVVINDGKVLLSKDQKDPFWKFPGGTVEDEHSFRENALRELKEETNLEATLEKEPILYTFHMEKEGADNYYVLIHYIATKVTGAIKINDPVIEQVKYFDLNELPDDLAPNVKPVLDEVRERMNASNQ